MYPQYMCILLYVTLSFGVMVFQISIVNWGGVHISSVYVHSVICETYLV